MNSSRSNRFAKSPENGTRAVPVGVRAIDEENNFKLEGNFRGVVVRNHMLFNRATNVAQAAFHAKRLKLLLRHWFEGSTQDGAGCCNKKRNWTYWDFNQGDGK